MPEPDDKTPAWMRGLSPAQQAFFQLGFAGLVAVLFVWQLRDSVAEARANREMYREEQHAMRAELRAAVQAQDARSDAAENRAEKIAANVMELSFELRRTADALRSAGLKIERAAEKVGGSEQGTTAPAPRAKGEPTVPALFRGFRGSP